METIISIRAEDEQAPLLIQREVGRALRLSFEAVTSEPVPTNMALLLLRLALAQSLRVRVEQETEADREKDPRLVTECWTGLVA